MKLSNYVAEYLSKHTSHIFSGSGGVVLHLNDSFSRHKELTLVPCENEQAASIAAEAYGRLKGLGVCIATSGPGLCNVISGIACAYYDSVPMLIIIGSDVISRLKTKETKNIRQIGFQEMDIVNICKTFTKYGVSIRNSENILYELQKCIYFAQEGRKGPVLIEIPDCKQRDIINISELKEFKHE